MPPLLVALFAVVWLYRSPRSASDLEIVPDSVEYAVVAQRLATLGRVNIAIDGRTYPTRFAPWFSIVISPLYRLFPHTLGIGILAVLAAGVCGALAAYSIGRRLAGDWGGAAAALLLVTYKGYAAMARLLMTDVPMTAAALCACALYLRMSLSSRQSRSEFVTAGLLSALAFLMRLEGLAIVMPFALLAGKRMANLCAVLLPPVLAGLATLTYDRVTFGSWLRTGYNYWCAVPYDYPNLVFSTRYIHTNLAYLLARQSIYAIALGALGLVLLIGSARHAEREAVRVRGVSDAPDASDESNAPSLRAARERAAAWRVVAFGLLAALPISVFHLFYAYPGWRFNLAGYALGCVLGGAGIAAAFRELRRTAAPHLAVAPPILPLTLGAATAFAAVTAVRRPPRSPDRLLAAEAIARCTPPNAVILTSIDAVYLEPLALRGTARQVIPLSRKTEYASKYVTKRRIPVLLPPPLSFQDLRAPALLRGGSKEVVPFTAAERPNLIERLIRAGRPVYLDRAFLPGEGRVPDFVSAHFTVAPAGCDPNLLRLGIRG